MLTLHEPAYEDLWFRQKILGDEETMSYNHAWGGTIPFPEENWADWYDYWITNPDGKRYYRYLKDDENRFVGEIAYHFDEELKGFIADVIIFSEYRGRGYGNQGLRLLCTEARKRGVPVLYDDIAIDNPAIKLFLKHGFQEESRIKEKIMLKKNL